MCGSVNRPWRSARAAASASSASVAARRRRRTRAAPAPPSRSDRVADLDRARRASASPVTGSSGAKPRGTRRRAAWRAPPARRRSAGGASIRPSSSIISKPAPSAETLPRLPPGMTTQSGTSQSSCCTISMRDGLLALEAQRVHRVREVDAFLLGELLHDRHAAVEVGVEREDAARRWRAAAPAARCESCRAAGSRSRGCRRARRRRRAPPRCRRSRRRRSRASVGRRRSSAPPSTTLPGRPSTAPPSSISRFSARRVRGGTRLPGSTTPGRRPASRRKALTKGRTPARSRPSSSSAGTGTSSSPSTSG